MDPIYIDILNALQIEKSIEFKKIKENKDFEKIIIITKELLNVIYIEQTITLEQIINQKNPSLSNQLKILRATKKTLIKKLKQEIININDNHHLKLNEIISDKMINRNDLNFAINLLYNDEKIYCEIRAVKDYKEKHVQIKNIECLIKNINELKKQIIEILTEILEIRTKNRKPRKLKIIKYIKWLKNNKQNNQIIEEKIIEIKKLIHESDIKRQDEALKEYCTMKLTNIKEIIEQIKNIMPTDLTEEKCIYIIEQLQIGYKKVDNYIKHVLTKKKQELVKVRLNINLQQQKINEIMYPNNNYVWYMIQGTFSKEENKQDTLLAKTLLIIKLIDMIENNELNVFDISKQIETEKQK